MHKQPQNVPLHWLWLGVTALGIAGIFALVLVIGRTPQLAALSVFQQLFSVALVVHVDLSVLIWFLCIGGMGWSLIGRQLLLVPTYWARTGFITVAVATGLIATSPLNPHWEVLKSNYIPVLNNLTFLLGLGLLTAGLMIILLPLVGVLLPSRFKHLHNNQICFAAAALTTLLALIGFALSARLLPAGLPTEEKFNTLFWAGGHILQFSYTLLMMAGWVMLAEAVTNKRVNRSLIKAACVIALIAAFMSLAGFLENEFTSAAFGDYQTRAMIELGGLAPTVLLIGIIVRYIKSTPILKESRAYLSSLIASIVLFGAGGVLGLMIAGQNVTIPAHYHGEIVGVTLALMGMAYVMLPRFGYKSVAQSGLAFWQPIIYGVGQLMHVGGLAYSGGYGVLRKTAGGFTDMAPDVKAALGIMGLGGTLAIIGGLLFVVVMLKARCHKLPGVTPVS